MSAPVEVDTRRLRLRRPVDGADRDDYVALHSDPATYTHAPSAMPDRLECQVRFDANLAHWAEHGFGHLVVEERESGRTVGWGGLRIVEDGLHLYYRLAADRLGRGYGREVARACVAAALEHRPDLPLVAYVKPHNHASLATAASAGLVEVRREPHPHDEPGDPPSVVLQAPTLTVVDRDDALRGDLDDALRGELVDVWCRVNDAGGAVGFRPGASRADVEASLAVQEAPIHRGLGALGLLRAPDPTGGALLGFGFWGRGDWWGHEHVLTLHRLMVDPERQGRGAGRLLMAGMHGVARRLPDVELLRLQYRSGLGVGDFYAGLGWVETGRQPLGLRLSPDDRRDDVSMARRPDGSAPTYDGRT